MTVFILGNVRLDDAGLIGGDKFPLIFPDTQFQDFPHILSGNLFQMNHRCSPPPAPRFTCLSSNSLAWIGQMPGRSSIPHVFVFIIPDSVKRGNKCEGKWLNWSWPKLKTGPSLSYKQKLSAAGNADSRQFYAYSVN